MNVLFVYEPQNCLLLDQGIAFDFPLDVLAVGYHGDGIEIPDRKGHIYFKNDVLFEEECQNSPITVDGMTNYDTARIMNNREIFAEEGSNEWEYPAPMNTSVQINGERLFIYGDLFQEIYGNDASGNCIRLCMVPLGEQTPGGHLMDQENGNYDYDEINGWDVYNFTGFDLLRK